MTEQEKAGRPAHEPTEERKKMVQAMASYGIPQEEIAEVIGISHVTLRKHYGRELRIAATLANSTVAQSLFQSATAKKESGAKVSAQKFWLECRAGWKRAGAEPPEREIIPEVLGKKAQQLRDAEEAGIGTDWGDDLTPRGMAN
jgi:hypothetical protein